MSTASKNPSRPSLLRRLKTKTSTLSLSGLRSSRRSLADFHIRLQDPHRVYSPTDIVKGSVCITVDRALTLTHLVVNLVGRVDFFSSTTKEAVGKRRREWDDEYDDGTGSGGAVLCRDEMVLCGEGRLEPGVYEFRFELEFVLAGKTIGGLPSSLDFEKGSISYAISSTLTRPTTSSPTTSCTTKISLLETIDIARLHPPKPRFISMEPRRSRNKNGPSSPKSASMPSSPNSSIGHLPLRPSSDGGAPLSPTCTKTPQNAITATLELLKAGALPGDSIPLKISIQHIKKIKSLNGIILTLYRQTRFDIPPASTLSKKQVPLKKALSAGGGGGGGTFRKDMAQTVMPLITDPKTLTTVVRANLRVPEDAFPTIANLPGGEVSFRYFIEVVVDLGGKLSNRDELFGSGIIPGLQRTGCAAESRAGGGFAVEGGVLVETERIRREKSVVFCKFEVVVGSVDSVGGKGRRRGAAKPPQVILPEDRRYSIGGVDVVDVTPPPTRQGLSPAPSLQPAEAAVPNYTRRNPNELLLLPSTSDDLPPVQLHHFVPPPEEPEEEMDEKTRIRLAEQRLLPSAPSGVAGPSNAPITSHFEGSAPQLEPGNHYFESAPSAPPLSPEFGPAPVVDFAEPHPQTEDKQELERRRLMMVASSPDDDGDIGHGEGGSGGGGASAPVIDDMESIGGGLPRYER